MKVHERFLNYVRVDTQSDPKSDTSPTTMKQKDLAKILVEELHDLGIDNAVTDDYGYVYALVEGNVDATAIGFVAHMDTAPDYSGKDVNPRVIENYDGEDIALSATTILSVKDFPEMIKQKGKDIIVTDGSTLLGADDKAGIAEIMTMISHLVKHPEIDHGPIYIAFTPDEEVGKGVANFDLSKFEAEFAYTVDGGGVDCIDYENFNAAAAVVEVQGVSIHPGSAKNKMINALHLGQEFDSLLPTHMRPEHTDGYDGFYHLGSVHGDIDHCILEYIVRNHDEEKFNSQKEWMLESASFLNKKFGKDLIEVKLTDTYANMKKHFADKMYIVDIAHKAIESVGLTPRSSAIRGGTDGAMLTYMGLPCPNLGTGGGNAHGRYEFCCIQDMELVVKILLSIVKQVSGVIGNES